MATHTHMHYKYTLIPASKPLWHALLLDADEQLITILFDMGCHKVFRCAFNFIKI